MESAKTDVRPVRKTDEAVRLTQAPSNTKPDIPGKPVIEVDHVDFHYGASKALHGINFAIPEKKVTAFIGPSGCGKSTLLRCLNRMNDLVDHAKVTAGEIRIGGGDINTPEVDVIELREKVGMVFQKQNHLPKTIYDNIAYGLRISGGLNKKVIDETGALNLPGA